MCRAMTTTFATTRIFRGIPEHDAFTDQTYDLIDAFHDELAQTTGGQPLSNAVVMAPISCSTPTGHTRAGSDSRWTRSSPGR